MSRFSFLFALLALNSLQTFTVGDDLKLGPKAAQPAQIAKPSSLPADETRAGKTAPAGPVRTAATESSRDSASSTRKPAYIALRISAGADSEQAWSNFFSQHQDVPREDVRETVRQLMSHKHFDQVAALIRGALLSGQVQPWMYEAMALAMQAAGSPPADVERALMSAVDFGENVGDLMYVAQYMARSGLEQRAIQVFRQAATIDPTRPEPYVFGMQLAQRLNDTDAIQWASLGILSLAWPNDKRELEQSAYRAALAAIERLSTEKKTKAAARFRTELETALIRDCLISVTWTGDADVDMFVEEPAGTVCSFRNPRTTSGGVMLGSSFALGGKRAAKGSVSETYACPQAFSGNYRFLLRRVWGKVTAGKVTVDVYTHYGTRHVQHHQRQMALGDQDAVGVFDLRDGRRQEPLREQQVANAAMGQVTLNQAILNQQLNGLAGTGATTFDSTETGGTSNFGKSRAGLFGGFPLVQGVGYQPVIITLPGGANFSATGVISADRRYVRITALPLFSQIGMVTTFNTQSGSTGTSPTPPPGGGGVSAGTGGFPPPSTGTTTGT